MNNYYYIDEATKQQSGPFALSDLRSKNIRPQTMVWCAGMSDWVEAKTVAELQFLFSSATQPPQPNAAPNATSYQTQNTGQTYAQPQGNAQYQNQNRQNTSLNNSIFNNVDIRPMPKSWLVESILATILCCQPLAIVGIVYATKVESRYYAGDYDAAMDASKNAKLWTLIGVGLTLLGYFCYFLLIMVGIFGSL